ncbi:DNA repair protein RadA [Clostridium sp. MSJ-11]|uniref:DNA repair protein RadA n=1 Tax=Clostridium mobile TaxID=2841512 RepID=A0ABS6EIF7_9CLOT|nr:DNA repair protein RadA [Clostridium mobile]MBU5485003.1 DNA repair protein RadA [Clostridium mobile]
MGKIKNYYVCQECGYEALKWSGKCPDCDTWNSMVEEVREAKTSKSSSSILKISNEPQSILEIKSLNYERLDTDIKELNRVMGGGIVKGSLILISGDPGIGKSTLLLQVANNISKKYGKVLYISGEESEEQIKIRGERLQALSKDLYLLSETNIENIEHHVNKFNPIFVIVDSVQTLYHPSISSAPGSVSQVREGSNSIMRIGKSKGIPFFIVAHVTKQGALAGPKVLEHMVDTVLHFEGERTEEFRILRTIKNRFGTTSEIGVFEMREKGLEEVANPSAVFLEDTDFNKEGSIVIGVMEGSRPILVEVQALVTETKAAMPRRTSVGIDNPRLNLILAVLEKKLRLPFYKYDVYINVVGGLNIEGTFGDLGIALALISSIKSCETKLEKLLVVGEIGLTGEVRPVSFSEKIVNEGKKMGFKNFIVPQRNKDKILSDGISVMGVSTLKEVINKVF